MKNLIYPVLILTVFWACGDDRVQVGNAAGLKLDEFEIHDLPGSDSKRAIKPDASGKILEEGILLNGQRNGTWVVYQQDRDIPRSIANYVGGQLNGPYFEYSPYGQTDLMCSYRNNLLEGRFVRLKNIRKSEEGFYKNGKLEGVYRKFFEGKDQVQQEANYKDGQLHGPNVFFNSEGDTVMLYDYKNGEKVSGGMVAKSN